MKAPIVLIASADDWTRQFSQLMLSQLGLRVEHASSAEEALQKADLLRPAALVAHVSLPGGGDGLALRSRLRAHTTTRDVPFMMVSGSQRAWLSAMDIVLRFVLHRTPASWSPSTLN